MRRGGFRYSLLIVFVFSFLTGTFSAIRPAAAVCDGCVVNAIISTRLPFLYLRMVPADKLKDTDVDDPTTKPTGPLAKELMQPLSLVDYFEDVWWPRQIILSQKEMANMQQFMTLLKDLDSRLAEGKSIQSYSQKMKEMNVKDALGYSSVDDVVCGPASANMSTIAARYIAGKYMRDASLKVNKQNWGSSTTPGFSKGPNEGNMEFVKRMQAMGLIPPDGIDGATATLGAGGDEKLAFANTDIYNLWGVKTLTGPAGGDDPGKPTGPNDTRVIKMMIDSMYSPITTPISKSALANVNAQSAEYVAERSAYALTQSIFASSLIDEAASHTGMEGLEAQQSIQGMLEKAGFNADIIKDLIIDGKMSPEAIDYARYHIYNNDPATMTEKGSWGGDNLSRLQAISLMQQSSLLYDIREVLQKIRVSQDVMGSLANKENYQKLEQMANDIATTN